MSQSIVSAIVVDVAMGDGCDICVAQPSRLGDTLV